MEQFAFEQKKLWSHFVPESVCEGFLLIISFGIRFLIIIIIIIIIFSLSLSLSLSRFSFLF